MADSLISAEEVLKEMRRAIDTEFEGVQCRFAAHLKMSDPKVSDIIYGRRAPIRRVLHYLGFQRVRVYRSKVTHGMIRLDQMRAKVNALVERRFAGSNEALAAHLSVTPKAVSFARTQLPGREILKYLKYERIFAYQRKGQGTQGIPKVHQRLRSKRKARVGRALHVR